MEEIERIQKALERIKNMDFDTKELRAEMKIVEAENKKIMEGTRIDWETMHRTFNV